MPMYGMIIAKLCANESRTMYSNRSESESESEVESVFCLSPWC